VLRCGIDSLDIKRVEDGIARLGEQFLDRFFTSAERAECGGKASRLAARIAYLRSARPSGAEAVWRRRSPGRRDGPDPVGRQPDAYRDNRFRRGGRMWRLRHVGKFGTLFSASLREAASIFVDNQLW
jgi:hypothetical protein